MLNSCLLFFLPFYLVPYSTMMYCHDDVYKMLNKCWAESGCCWTRIQGAGKAGLRSCKGKGEVGSGSPPVKRWTLDQIPVMKRGRGILSRPFRRAWR